jgi:hypothetical protein
MTWLNSLFVAVLPSLAAAAAASVVAARWVIWYQVPIREGQSAYSEIAIVLFGGLAGFLGGLILSRFVGGPGAAGFLTSFGVCSGVMVALTAVAAAISWSLADIPPTLGGQQLDLIVEFRLPRGATRPVAGSQGDQHVFFASMGSPGQPDRASQGGVLDVAKARQEDGRWIVPGSVFVFTSRGRRDVSMQLGDGPLTAFQLPLPGHPGPEYERWSVWEPPASAPGKPWPDTELSYRFRIQRRPPAQVVADGSGQRFAALGPSAPLEQWLGFYTSQRDTNRDEAIAKVAVGRQAELARCLRSPDYGVYRPALYCVQYLSSVDTEVLQALRDFAARIEEKIREFNAMSPQQEGYSEFGKEIMGKRYAPWANAWTKILILRKVDGCPAVEDILRLAAVRKENADMQSIVSGAQNLLDSFLPPLKNQ